MSFMDSLSRNPSGGSGIYGQTKKTSDDDVLALVNQMKDREMLDYKNKADFNADLSLRQEARMRSLFPPGGQQPGQPQQQGQPNGQMNTVMARDPNEMTGYEKANIGIRQQGLNLDRQEVAQRGKLGEEALNIRGKQQELNQQKSDQINATKQADMERKIAETDAKIQLANKQLESKNANAEASLQARKDLNEAMAERHKLEITQKDKIFEESKRVHDAQIKKMEEDLENAKTSEVVTENEDGTKKVVTTKRGEQTGLRAVKTPNGNYNIYDGDKGLYSVPADKIDDWKANHSNSRPPKEK